MPPFISGELNARYYRRGLLTVHGDDLSIHNKIVPKNLMNCNKRAVLFHIFSLGNESNNRYSPSRFTDSHHQVVQTTPDHLLPLLKTYPAHEMEEWQVGDAARNPRNDYPELIKPVHGGS